jgi:putative transposase
MLLKTFKYRLYPTMEQQRLLERQLEACRWLWNTLLAERKQAWEERQETLDYYAQKAELPSLKATERPSRQDVHSQVLQDVVLRLTNACDAVFRRLKAAEEPGYPRFRGRGRYDRLTFPQVPVGGALEEADQRLVVSKVGRIKALLQRPQRRRAQDGHSPPHGHWQVVRLDCRRVGAHAPALHRTRGGH